MTPDPQEAERLLSLVSSHGELLCLERVDWKGDCDCLALLTSALASARQAQREQDAKIAEEFCPNSFAKGACGKCFGERIATEIRETP